MRSIAAIVLLTVLAPVCGAAPPDTSGWRCERCPFATGHQADLSAGTTYVSEDAATLGDATGYDEEGGYLNVDGSGLYATADHRLSWRVEDLGLASRAAEMEGARGGTFDYRLAWRQQPRHRHDDTQTIFTRRPGGLLELPGNWTHAGTTSGFADLAANLAPRDIESERRTLEIGGRYQPTARFRLFADFGRQENDGVTVLGAPYFTNASLLPRRFDHRTDQVDAGIRYDSARGHLKLAYYGSFFDNRFDAVRWESPFTTAPGAELSALAEAPDNDFQQLSFTGAYRFSMMDTRVSFSAALGKGTQDEQLLPYTTNPNLIPAPLPRSSLDAEIDTTNAELVIISRPLPKTRVKAAIRYDERDNKTSRFAWTRVIAETFLSGESELNVPYGYERLRLNLSADYEWSEAIRVSGGYDYTELDRAFQEVAEQREDTGWGRVQWRPVEYLDITARGGISRRGINRYDETLAAGFEQNPLLRKFNLAYRYRQFGELSASVTPPGWPVTLSGQASYADISYTSSSLGLTASDELRFAIDLNWAISGRTSVYVSGGIDDVESDQAGSAAFSTPDWEARLSDRYYNLGGGIRIAGIADKMDLQLDYTRARGSTQIDVSGGGGPDRFPDLESTHDSLRALLLYRWSGKLESSLLLRYEHVPTEDWALQDVAPGTLGSILTLGAQPYDDEVWMAGVSFRYLLGER
jgi:MtrB/PioB family decaheme-associated outer membrane protein